MMLSIDLSMNKRHASKKTVQNVPRMSEQFFEKPILNSPNAYPGRHWELDTDGQPTNRILENRRRSDLITPVPKTKKQR